MLKFLHLSSFHDDLISNKVKTFTEEIKEYMLPLIMVTLMFYQICCHWDAIWLGITFTTPTEAL